MKRTVSIIMILTLLTVFTTGGYAEEIVANEGLEQTMSLSLDQAVDLAIENSLDISTAEMDYELAKLDSKEKKDLYDAYEDQKVTFYNSGSIESQMMTLMTSKGYNYQLSVTTRDYSEKAIQYTANDLEAQVIDLYYDIVYTLEDIKIKETALVRAQDTYDDTREKYELGRIAKNELDSADFNLTNALLQLENIKLDYDNYMAEFNMTLGLAIDRDHVLTSNLEYQNFSSDLTLDQMLQNTLDKSSSYQSAKYGYDYYRQYCDLLGAALTDTNFGQEAYANMIIAENGLKQIENQIHLSVIKTLNTFTQLENNIDISMRNIQEIEKRIEQQELRYQMGLCTIDDVLAQYDSLDSAEISLLSLTKTYCVTAEQFNNSIEEITE
jgi:outer membrane protein TolC